MGMRRTFRVCVNPSLVLDVSNGVVEAGETRVTEVHERNRMDAPRDRARINKHMGQLVPPRRMYCDPTRTVAAVHR